MDAKELLKPRYEVIADYPGSTNIIGDILECPNYENDFTANFWVEANEKYPHLFRKMNWWENRKREDMPKKIVSKADDKNTVFEIRYWDMESLLGFTDDESGYCGLLTFKPEYGYFPID